LARGSVMTVHKTYFVDGNEYETSGYTEKRADGTIWKTRYSIYREDSGRGGYIGEVDELHYRHGIRYRIVGWDSIVNVENQCTSLEEAITALVLELDRRATRRKATQVSWGDVIVPSVKPWVLGNGEIRHLVYDAGRPEGDESVGRVIEITPGQWQATLTMLALQGVQWRGSPVSIRDTLAAAVQDIVDVIAKDLRPPYQTHDDVSVAQDDEDEDDEEQERPDDALTCPLLDTPVHVSDCPLCGDRGWVTEDQIEEYLGPNRIGCVFCEGEGYSDGNGPVTWTCHQCLGTGSMPIKALEDASYHCPLTGLNLAGADLRGLELEHLAFTRCRFSHANFQGANLTNTTFTNCEFASANPELAASLNGTRLHVTGLSEEQLVQCTARGAVIVWQRRKRRNGGDLQQGTAPA
jgi:Pentapeptide repeats (9 copies)